MGEAALPARRLSVLGFFWHPEKTGHIGPAFIAAIPPVIDPIRCIDLERHCTPRTCAQDYIAASIPEPVADFDRLRYGDPADPSGIGQSVAIGQDEWPCLGNGLQPRPDAKLQRPDDREDEEAPARQYRAAEDLETGAALCRRNVQT
jgi:hypothetical protein